MYNLFFTFLTAFFLWEFLTSSRNPDGQFLLNFYTFMSERKYESLKNKLYEKSGISVVYYLKCTQHNHVYTATCISNKLPDEHTRQKILQFLVVVWTVYLL